MEPQQQIPNQMNNPGVQRPLREITAGDLTGKLRSK